MLTLTPKLICFGGGIGIFTTVEMKNNMPTHDGNTQAIIDLAKDNGVDVHVFHPQDVAIGVDEQGLAFWLKGHKYREKPFDVVLPRLGARYVTPTALAILKHLQLMGAKLVNPANAIATAEDKFATHQALALHGIPQPTTLFAIGPFTRSHLSEFGPDVFVKDNAYTSGAKGVQKVSTSSVNNHIGLNMPDRIVQAAHVAPDGFDYKVVVVDDQVVYASKEKRFETQEKQATALDIGKPHSPYQRHFELARQAMAAVGLRSGSVDIVDSERGPLVLEVNPSNGFGPSEKPWVPQAILNYAQRLARVAFQ